MMILTCSHCFMPATADTWVPSGKCRACLVGHSESGNECAWCLSSLRIEPRAGDSHGICAVHELELLAELNARLGAKP